MTELVVVPSTQATPPVTDAPEFSDNARDVLGIEGGIGVSERLDVYASGIDNAPLFVGAKYEIAGRRARSLLPYGAIYYSRYWADGSVTQGSNEYPLEENALGIGIGLGGGR